MPLRHCPTQRLVSALFLPEAESNVGQAQPDLRNDQTMGEVIRDLEAVVNFTLINDAGPRLAQSGV